MAPPNMTPPMKGLGLCQPPYQRSHRVFVTSMEVITDLTARLFIRIGAACAVAAIPTATALASISADTRTLLRISASLSRLRADSDHIEALPAWRTKFKYTSP